MKRDAVNYVLVGAVVLVALAILLLALLRITGTTGPTDRYDAYYAQVSGIRYGTPVYYEGYRIGQVSAVAPEREGVRTRFRVELAVERGWPIPSDSVAEIASDGLLSDVFVHVRQGEAGSTLEPGATIVSREGADLFAALGDLAREARGLTDEELRPLLRRVGGRVERIAGSLEDGTPRIVDRVQELLASLQRSATSAEDVLDGRNRAALRHTLANFETASAAAARLAEDLRTTRSELQGLLAEARALVAENRPGLRRTVTTFETAVLELAARLDGIVFNLEEASRHFNEFARVIRRNPNRLLYTPERDEVLPEGQP